MRYMFILFFSLIRLCRLARLPALMLLLSAVCFSATAEQGEEFEMFNITAGQIGIQDKHSKSQRYGVEYRFKSFAGPGNFRLIPSIGAAVSNNGTRFFYSDVKHDFYLNRRWILIPSFGAGIFHDSEEIDLGNSLEFRSGIEIAYQFRNRVRAGVAVFHLSNGGISNDNPGTESLVFSVCFPLS